MPVGRRGGGKSLRPLFSLLGPLTISNLLLLDSDAAACSDRRSRISRIALPHLTVVDNRASNLLPDLDSELIHSTAARYRQFAFVSMCGETVCR